MRQARFLVVTSLLLLVGCLLAASPATAKGTKGGVVSNFPSDINGPAAITTGPDGALWFTNHDNNSIGRITTGGVVTNYTGAGISGPFGITAGPYGALWFTNDDNNSIGRITTGGLVTNYTGTGINEPYGITTGPDGALWFTNISADSNSIGRIHHRPGRRRGAPAPASTCPER